MPPLISIVTFKDVWWKKLLSVTNVVTRIRGQLIVWFMTREEIPRTLVMPNIVFSWLDQDG